MAKRITTPTTSTNNPAADGAPGTEKGPARVREKRRRNSVTDAPTPDYVELGVPEELIPLFEKARLDFLAIGRLETDQVFDYGSIIAVVHEHASDQKTFDRWSRKIFKLKRRGADNYIRVHRRLQDHRERLVQLSVPADVLYTLSSAEPEKVEEVAALLESGRELTGKEIKAIAANGADAVMTEDGGIEVGGVAGLKTLIAEKVSTGVPAFMDELVAIQSDIHIALVKHHNGKRVDKGAAQAALVYSARLAAEQLKSLTWMARMAGAPFHPGAVHVRPLSAEGRWYELQQVLERMNFEGHWPDAAEVGSWLADTVVPLIDWALGSLAAKARAPVEQMAKAAEAEREKAEKEKAKARATAQKERAKAKAADKKAGKVKPAPTVAKPIVVPIVPVVAAEPDSSPAIAGGVNATESRGTTRVIKASLEAPLSPEDLPPLDATSPVPAKA